MGLQGGLEGKERGEGAGKERRERGEEKEKGGGREREEKKKEGEEGKQGEKLSLFTAKSFISLPSSTLERLASMVAIISPTCSRKNSLRATSLHDLSSVMHTLSAAPFLASGGYPRSLVNTW